MPASEPVATAILLTICGVLLLVSVLSSRASQRIGVPIALFFLLVGMLAGSEGIGGIPFDDYRLAFRIGSLALALILFDGGLNTPLDVVRRVWAPAGALASVGDVGWRGVERGERGGGGSSHATVPAGVHQAWIPRSSAIAVAALWPQAPPIEPPGWVDEPHRYTFSSPER